MGYSSTDVKVRRSNFGSYSYEHCAKVHQFENGCYRLLEISPFLYSSFEECAKYLKSTKKMKYVTSAGGGVDFELKSFAMLSDFKLNHTYTATYSVVGLSGEVLQLASATEAILMHVKHCAAHYKVLAHETHTSSMTSAYNGLKQAFFKSNIGRLRQVAHSEVMRFNHFPVEQLSESEFCRQLASADIESEDDYLTCFARNADKMLDADQWLMYLNDLKKFISQFHKFPRESIEKVDSLIESRLSQLSGEELSLEQKQQKTPSGTATSIVSLF